MINPDRDTEPDNESFFSLRTLSFALIALVIGIAVYFQKTQQPAPRDVDVQTLQTRHADFVMKLIVTEALVADQYPAEQRAEYVATISRQLDSLKEQEAFRTEAVEIQKRILQIRLGGQVDPPPTGQDGLALEYRRLYLLDAVLAEGAALFELPTGGLSRVKNLRLRGEQAEAARLEERLRSEAMGLHLRLLGGVFGLILCMGASFLIIFRLFVRPPLALYGPQLDLVPPGENRVLLETALLYLFLMFPLGGILAGLVPEQWRLPFHLLFLPVIMAISLYYFASNTTPGILKLVLFGEAPRMRIFWREVFYGVVGFFAVFPFAVLVLGFFLSMLLYFGVGEENASSLRFAHPVVFQIAERPVLIFVLAVGVVPLMEEIVFRGLLYGFFRKQAGPVEVVEAPFGRILLAGAAPGFISGFFFAILHPQGWPAIPYLTLLGMGLCYVRELRPTIVAPTVAHALVNALAVGLSYLVVSA